ncbi:ABC transporter permease [Pimelobacter simplex]|uniref:Nucleoside ABC transporter, permease protein 1 n=1 Tax=Nocardioides simplex TaxID=2045 RepID=A0A0C5XBN4_NOCSI|nr:ABC transporter permease [Pimelobacter simplex]AJR18209.1 Nucleoside ABC transporter, permease protein 1 [Pimelobacter simplex]GEB15436.1 ABC transporter permease [Pimelobacter simplex]SFN15084.1 simple sugar transport system permease protein [Pimelobacter simplex]
MSTNDEGQAVAENPETPENPENPEVPADQKPREPGRFDGVLREIATGNALVAVLSVLLAMVIGSLMILLTDQDVRDTLAYIGSRPSDFFNAVGTSITDAYTALFRGAIYNTNVDGFELRIRPLTETLKFAAPLILAGLGVGLAFRAGMFNIGGRGQMLLAGTAAGWVGVGMDLPMAVHLPLAVVAGALAGALWAGIAGFLKAQSGAHEVIVTIMLNYVGYYLVFYVLSKQGLLQAPGSLNPKSKPMPESVILPKLLGDRFSLHLGFLIALVAVGFTWWLLNKSALGFRFRAVGENPDAARASGINVGRTYITVMLIAGGLVGLAGVNQILGTATSGVTVDMDAGIGFDAITVALLGRSRPLGILAAGLLFGALKAGGFSMAAAEGIPVEIVLVIQSLIVLFIAAPPLVRAIFRLPKEATA